MMAEEQAFACHVDAEELRCFIEQALAIRGADEPSRQAVAQALVIASLMGTDSHGVRLLPHYLQALSGGRINGAPQLMLNRRLPATAVLNADNAFGHLAGYRAIQHACDMAREVGIGAVAVSHSSHFGAAGCYALAAAEQGMVGMAMCNSDPFVLLHGSRRPFHGTNPIAFAAPVEGDNPLLLDMATSAIPWNRVQQYAAIGRDLPPDIAATTTGETTTDASQAEALLPLGGAGFGFKGAGLACMVEVLSSMLANMLNGFRLLPMAGPDMTTPRGVGHFFLVMNPEAFTERAHFQARMQEYLADLRSMEPVQGRQVLAPGDREWNQREQRRRQGIPLDWAQRDAYRDIALQLGLERLNERP
uniref:Ldh family oxidoreductase n=1 Tax=Halomonas sp. TaxID=1486246 RepID=UPI00262C8A09|nr:Ldh family oxidoreductase [Halomonas sp.]